ncbi:MAG: hypothetical protein U0133_02065 [Gemmatimonadales bacterium]
MSGSAPSCWSRCRPLRSRRRPPGPETGGGIGEIKDGGGASGLVLGQTTLTEVRQLYASRRLREPGHARAARPLTPALR